MRAPHIALILLALAGCTRLPAATVATPSTTEGERELFAASLSQIDATAKQHLTATQEQTAVLREIKAEIEAINKASAPSPEPTKEVVPESPTETGSESATDRASTADDHAERPVLWVFYAPFNYPPCDQLKADIEAGKFAEFDVRPGDDYTPSAYPAIRFQARDGSYKATIGYSSGTLTYLRQQLLGEPVQVGQPVVQASSGVMRMPGPRWNWEGDWSPSYDQAAQHLRNVHGIDPSGMSMEDMQAAHDNAHNGQRQYAMPTRRVYYSRPQTVRYRSSCPGGMCPR